MEKRHNIICSHPSNCGACSLFNISEPYFKSFDDLKDNCSEYYKYSFSPETRIIFNGNEIEKRNQKRCCEGSRTLVYMIDNITDEAITDETEPTIAIGCHSTPFPLTVTQSLAANSSAIGDNPSATESITTTPSPVDVTLFLSVSITGIALLFLVTLLCCMIVKCRRQSKTPGGTQNPQYFLDNRTYSSDGVAEYSTVDEVVTLVKALTDTKTISKGTENAADNYFVLEKSVCTNTYDSNYPCSIPGQESIYNTLHEKQRRSTDIEDSLYSHFSDYNENVYSTTLHR